MKLYLQILPQQTIQILSLQSYQNSYLIIMHLVFRRSQLNIQRGVEKNCQDCAKKFSILLREHQCKRCLKAVCSDCGNFKNFTFGSNSLEKQQHRICKSCKDSSDYITSLIKNNNLKFGEMSDIGKDWVKRITQKPPTYGTDNSQHKIFTKQVFLELWATYSFQLRELVGLLTFDFEQSNVYDVVFDVYKTVVSASQGATLTNIIYLIVYALCFCSSDKAVLLVLYLSQLKNQHKDVKAVAFRYVKALPYQNQYQKIENYLYYRFDKYIDSFFVNGSSIECSVFFLGEILKKKNIEDLFIFFSSHVYINRQALYLRAAGINRDFVDLMLLRYCSLLQINSNYKQIKNKNINFFPAETFFDQTLKKVQNQSKTLSEGDRSFLQEVRSSSSSAGKAKPNFAKREIPTQNNINLQDSILFDPNDEKEQRLASDKKSNESKVQTYNFEFSSQAGIRKASEDSIKQNFINQKIYTFRKNSICSRCEFYQQQSQKLRNDIVNMQSQKKQLKSTIAKLELEVKKLKKQMQQFDAKMIQLISEKNIIQKAHEQSKKQLKQAMSISLTTFGENQAIKKQLEAVQKQLRNEINRQKDLKSISQSKDSTINQQIINLQVNKKTIKRLTIQNQTFKQDKQSLSNINIALLSQKKQLQNKLSQQVQQLSLLQDQLYKSLNENKTLQIINSQQQTPFLSKEEANQRPANRIKILQQQILFFTQQNSNLNKQMSQLRVGWKQKQEKNKQEVRQLQNRQIQLSMSIFSLEQQLKSLLNKSNSGANGMLQQTSKEYEQKLQKKYQQNKQLEKQIDQLQSLLFQKQQSINLLEKDNSSIKKQIQENKSVTAQLQLKLKQFQASQGGTRNVQKELRNAQIALRLQVENKKQELGLKDIEISSLTSGIVIKNTQIQRNHKQIAQYQKEITQLKSLIQHSKKDTNLLKPLEQDKSQQNRIKSNQKLQVIQQKQKQLAQLRYQNASMIHEISQMRKNNKYFTERCESLDKQIDQQTEEIQKLTIKNLTAQEQFKHTKFQLEKANKQNNQLKSSLKLAQTLLSQKQDEIKTLNSSFSRQSAIEEKLTFEKLKEIESKNEALKQSQKQSKGLIRKMDELSSLMMQLQGQKLELAEQNFYLKQLLNDHRVAF